MKKYIVLFALLFTAFASAQVFIVNGQAAAGNTDSQQLTLIGNTLSLQNGGTIDLSSYLDNTDGQTVTDLSLTGNILSITLSGGNTQTVDLSAISLQDNSVTSAKILDGTILPADLANQSYGLLGYNQVGTSTNFGITTVLNNIFAQSSITPAAPLSSSDFLLTRESAIPTNTKLSSIQQIADKMSIGSTQIADGSIATADYSDLSITGVKIANGAVSNTKLLADAVDGSKVQDGSLSGLDIANGSLSVSELSATGTPSASTYLRGDNTWATVAGGGGTPDDNTVTSAKIVDGAIVNADINATAAIDATKVGLGTVDNTELGSLDNIANNVQQQIDTKAPINNPTFTGTINGKTPTNLMVSNTAGLTGATQVLNVVAGTTANIAGWTADPNRLAIPTDATPASISTGTALDLGGYIQYNTTPSAATTYTTTNFKTGGYVEAFINTTSEPTVTGATKFPGTAAWETGVDMLMCVKALGNATVKYFFVKLQ